MWDQLVKDFSRFMDSVTAFITDIKINVDDLQIDHAAIRIKNDIDVAILEHELEQVGKKIADAVVNGRRICIFKLHKPLKYEKREIYCVELPYPATDHRYPTDGWEHVEFIIEGSSPTTLENEFSKMFPNVDQPMREKYNFKITTPDVKAEELVNTTIVLQKHPGLAIKFHCYPIEQIVAS